MSNDTDAAVEDLNTSLVDVHLSVDQLAGNEDDNELALKGVIMVLNNKWQESTELFDKYKEHSSIMHFGGAFVNYMQGKPLQ